MVTYVRNILSVNKCPEQAGLWLEISKSMHNSSAISINFKKMKKVH